MDKPTADNSPATLDRPQPVTEVDVGRSVRRSDSRSSSLSELADTVEEHTNESTDRSPVESEAETERLDITPRRPRTTTDVTAIGRTPSKLANEIYMDDENIDPGSPSARRKYTAGIGVSKGAAMTKDLHSESDEEVSGQRRKRVRDDSSHPEDDLEVEAPPRKRSISTKVDTFNGDQDVDEEIAGGTAEDEIPGTATVLTQEPDQEDIEALAQSIEHHAPSGRTTKGKKSKGKGKKAKGSETVDRTEGAEVVPDGDEVVEGENESEENGSPDEELNRRRTALDSLGSIEKRFVAFREQNLAEQIAQCSRELELLQQPNCQHPEYLLMLRPIDERRDKKIKEENFRIDYQMKHLCTKTVAERQQLQSQYRQEVREVRENTLEKCHEYLYRLQRDRRRCGADEREYTYRFNPKRSAQIQQQAAYNLEVSILAGINKYVGFPAAPEIAAANVSEADHDLQAMGIDLRPTQYVPQLFREPTRADRAAEEQFFEQNAWANPQHPAHTFANLHVRPASALFTPAGQTRTVDMHMPNGSASTIEIQSNPPSSAAAPGAGILNSLKQHGHSLADSPVANAKRAVSGPGPSRLSDAFDPNDANHLFFSTPAAERRSSVPAESSVKSAAVTMPVGAPVPAPGQLFATSAIHGSEAREMVAGAGGQAPAALADGRGGAASLMADAVASGKGPSSGDGVVAMQPSVAVQNATVPAAAAVGVVR